MSASTLSDVSAETVRDTVRSAGAPLVEVNNLTVSFASGKAWKSAVSGVSFHVAPGEILGIVGESGCGKSVTSFSIPRLHDERSTRYAGAIRFDGKSVFDMDKHELTALRGEDIGFIFQDPMSSLDPLMKVGAQLAETVHAHHKGLPKADVVKRCAEALAEAGADNPQAWMGKYPHQMSGGQLQRVVIAMALINRPRLIIADEPTTALDVTIQGQLLRVFRRLRDDLGTAIILITHDMGVVAQICDRVAVMYLGQIVEAADVIELFARPCHPYTKGLLAATPPLEGARPTRLNTIAGSVPQLSDVSTGCRFATRCPFATASCTTGAVGIAPLGDKGTAGHWVRCARIQDVKDLPYPAATEPEGEATTVFDSLENAGDTGKEPHDE